MTNKLLGGLGAALGGLAQGLKTPEQERAEMLQEMKRRQTYFGDTAKTMPYAASGDWGAVSDLWKYRAETLGRFPGANSGQSQEMYQLARRAASGDKSAQEQYMAIGDRNTKVASALGLVSSPDPMEAAKLEGQKLSNEEKRRKLEGGDDAEVPAGQVEFESLIAGMSPEDQTKARRIKAGLDPRAVNNAVLSAIAAGTVDSLADAKGRIRQAEKFGEMTGSSRAKTIDSGFEKIGKINTGIGNINSAIDAVRGGASVGAIQNKFPSIRAASVELDNIQKSMALDVIGAVTFGALSQGELDLAKEVALPTGLDTQELIAHLEKRKAAQEKLRSYYEEQIEFLDQGGTVAGFLRAKKRGQGGAKPQSEGVQSRNIQVDF